MNALTDHAAKRIAQRNIPEIWIHLLMHYGVRRRQDGGIVRYLDHNAKKRLRKQLAHVMRRLDSLDSTYLIEGSAEPVVITAGHMTRHIHTR